MPVPYEKLVAQTVARWNQITAWLGGLDLLRRGGMFTLLEALPGSQTPRQITDLKSPKPLLNRRLSILRWARSLPRRSYSSSRMSLSSCCREDSAVPTLLLNHREIWNWTELGIKLVRGGWIAVSRSLIPRNSPIHVGSRPSGLVHTSGP
jgi:hypothetical protein